MTQEEKQLVLNDLCARLPYGVRYKGDCGWPINPYQHTTSLCNILNAEEPLVYLRPMSSMTEEEKEEIRQRFCYEWEESIPELMYYSIEIGDADCLIDWFLEHHFDHRGLIEKGLAIEAPEGMYNV